MKGCEGIREGLSAYIDGQAGPAETRKIEEHLSMCAQCRGTLDELRLAVSRLKGLEEVEPPSWLTQKVMARIRTEAAAGSAKQGFFERLFLPLSARIPLGAVAALLVAVTTYFLLQNLMPAMKEEQARLQTGQEPTAIPAPAPQSERVVAAEKTAQPTGQVVKREDKKADVRTPAPASLPQASPSEIKSAAPAAMPEQSARRSLAMSERAAVEFASSEKAKKEMADAKAAPAPAAVPAKTGEARSAAPIAGLVKTAPHRIILFAADARAAAARCMEIARQHGGTSIRQHAAEDRMVVEASLPAARLPELIAKLRSIGAVVDRGGQAPSDTTIIPIAIEITSPAPSGTK